MSTAARVMMNAALLEHMLISGSWPIIFLTLETGGQSKEVSNTGHVLGEQEKGRGFEKLTRELGLSRGLLSRRDSCGIVRHGDGGVSGFWKNFRAGDMTEMPEVMWSVTGFTLYL